MTGADAFALLIDPANRVAERVTLREGLWKSEVFAALSKATGIRRREYEKAAKDTEAIGLPDQADGNVEGWLFPASYEFDDSTTAAEQLRQMVAQTVKTLEGAGVAEDDWQETLTIASIVEGEVSGDADRAKVARVVLNRLEAGPPSYGLLQMDSTVHYAEQQRGKAGPPTSSARPTTRTTPTCSRACRPGPIGNPGAASIEAAAEPRRGRLGTSSSPSTRHRRDEVRHHAGRAHRNVQEFQAWCADERRTSAEGTRSSARPVAHSLSPVLHRAGYAAAGLTRLGVRGRARSTPTGCPTSSRASTSVARALPDDAAQGGRARGRRRGLRRRPPRRCRQHPRAPAGRRLGRDEHRRRRGRRGPRCRTCPAPRSGRWSSARAPRPARPCWRSPGSASRPSRSGPETPRGPPTCWPGRSTSGSACVAARSPGSTRGGPRATTSSSPRCRPRRPTRWRPPSRRSTPACCSTSCTPGGHPGGPRPPAAAGMTVVSGLDLLVHQAAEQFRLFTGPRRRRSRRCRPRARAAMEAA